VFRTVSRIEIFVNNDKKNEDDHGKKGKGDKLPLIDPRLSKYF